MIDEVLRECGRADERRRSHAAQRDFAAIRTGRANAALLDRVVGRLLRHADAPQPARHRSPFPSRAADRPTLG